VNFIEEKAMKVELTKKAARAIRRPVHGDGGFQGLLRVLQANLKGETLTLTPALAERVRRYLDDYGNGGFQYRLGMIGAFRLRSAARRMK
jgi:hypothetical protein